VGSTPNVHNSVMYNTTNLRSVFYMRAYKEDMVAMGQDMSLLLEHWHAGIY
jgi:hypothetical protein